MGLNRKAFSAAALCLGLTIGLPVSHASDTGQQAALWIDCANDSGADRWRLQIAACRILLSQLQQPEQQAIASLQLARALEALERNDAAMQALDDAIQYNPSYAEAHLNRGLLHRQAGRNHKAIADFTAAISIDPDDQSGYLHRGYAYAFEERYDAAIADYDRAIELKSDNPVAYINRGLTHRAMGRLAASLADFQAGLKADPTNTTLQMNLGVTYQDMDRPAEARQAYTQAVTLAPDLARGHRLLMVLLGFGPAEAEDLPAAIRHAETFLDLQPEDFEATYQLALLQMRNGDTDAAFRTHKHIITREPAYAEPYMKALQAKNYLSAIMPAWGAEADRALQACVDAGCRPFSQ